MKKITSLIIIFIIIIIILPLLYLYKPDIVKNNKVINNDKVVKKGEERENVKEISEIIEVSGYKYSIKYNPDKWYATSGKGKDSFGYYQSGIWLRSKKKGTDYESTDLHKFHIYEISFDYNKNIDAYTETPPEDEEIDRDLLELPTGLEDTKPEPPYPFKKDDFILVNTINGKKLYVSKTGGVNIDINTNDKLFIHGQKIFTPGSGVLLQEYLNNTMSSRLDIFSNYKDVFDGKESFSISYDINKGGSWEELKPELLKILKSFKVEKIKKTKN